MEPINSPIPQQVPESPPPGIPPSQPPTQSLFLQVGFKKIIFAIIIILLLVFAVFLILPKKGVQKISTPIQKTWEIIFTYDVNKDAFAFGKLTLLNKKITPDYRGAKFSSFILEVLDAKGKALYSQKVPVVTELPDYGGFSINPPSTQSAPQESLLQQNILYAPHIIGEKRILLKRDGKTVLELETPPVKETISSVFFSTKQAYAADSCQPIIVAFVSDNYTDFNQYHKDVQKYEQTFLSTDPYSTLPGMFEFKIIDNSQALGCGTRGLGYCIQQSNALIHQIAFGKYSNLSKIVVIANGPEQNPHEPGLLGISQGIGQDLAIFPNNFGNVSALTLTVARHEFLGHTVGMLYDRYVTNASVQGQASYGLIQDGLRSNCTDNSQGESWWKSAGSNTVVRGCGNQFATYGGTALTCVSQNPKLISGGDHTSIMSAGGCGGTQFDAIEKYWITHNVLPDYASCTTSSTQLPSPDTTITTTPSPTSAVTSFTVNGTVFSDTNNNQKKDTGEPGVPGATLTLIGGPGGTRLTGNPGTYQYSNLPGGDYKVKLTYNNQSITSDSFTLGSFDASQTVDFSVGVTSGGQNPIINPIVPTPTSTPTPTPTPVGGSGGGTGGFQPIGTPSPTPDQYYTCVPDPSCIKSGKSIQLCPLKCTPQ